MYFLRSYKGILKDLRALHNYKFIKTFIISTRCRNPTHYQTLGLPETCTNEEIKQAFLEKVKLFHPDKNVKNPHNHKCIIDINEAYSILSKSSTRTVYDNHLALQRKGNISGLETNCPNERIIVNYPEFWENRDRSKDKYYEQKWYYGIKGVKKLPNHYIATGAIIFMLVGAVFHYFLAKITSSFTLKQHEKRNFIASQNYMMSKEAASRNGNERQLVLLKEEYERQQERYK